MKALLCSALFVPLSASSEEIEGTVWYDSEGQVVLVEGPLAEPAPRPFVPGWRRAEIEREARRKNPLRWQRDVRRWNSSPWGWGGSYASWGWGWSVRPVTYPYTPARFRACYGGFGRGSSLIIRW